MAIVFTQVNKVELEVSTQDPSILTDIAESLEYDLMNAEKEGWSSTYKAAVQEAIYAIRKVREESVKHDMANQVV